jgi:DNA-binding MarR family transcriptional regulator
VIVYDIIGIEPNLNIFLCCLNKENGMRHQALSESNFDLWLLIGRANHAIMLVRQKELSQHHVPPRQTLFLYTLDSLGPKATLSKVAMTMERKAHVISRQAARMEKDGLIKRIHDTPKSRLLRLELTEKGLEIVKLARKSEAIDAIISFLNKEERRQMKSVLNRILVKVKEYRSEHN